MRHLFLASLLLISTSVFASTSKQCSLRAIDGLNSGICSDDEFTVALWNGDLQTVSQRLSENPNLLYSCNFSPSYVYNGSNSEMMNPLIFSVCHSKENRKLSLVQMLLDHGAGQEINCETQNLKITAKFCLSKISDDVIRSQVETLLKKYGMN